MALCVRGLATVCSQAADESGHATDVSSRRAFHFDILRSYADIYKSTTETLIDLWGEQLEKGGGVSARVAVSNDVKLLTLDVILQCAFSYESGCQRHSTPYTNAVMELIDCVYRRGLNVLKHPDFIFYLTPSGRHSRRLCNLVHSFAEEIIAKRRRALQLQAEAEEDVDGEYPESLAKRTDFLDTLLTARDSDGQSESFLRKHCYMQDGSH